MPWRTWTAAETTWVLYHQYAEALEGRAQRDWFVMFGDTDAVAAWDRAAMGQTKGVEYADIKVRGGAARG